jgi:hypothetical protein
MKTNMLKVASLIVGAAFFSAAEDSHAQVNAFLNANPNAVFGTSRVPAETAGLTPAVDYRLLNQKGGTGVRMTLDVVGMLQSPIYKPASDGAGLIIGTMPTVVLPADSDTVAVELRRPATTQGPTWRFAIYTNAAQARAAIAAWADPARGAAVLTPTAAQDPVRQHVDAQDVQWVDPAVDPLAPAAGSLLGFDYNSGKNAFFTRAYLTGKVIVIYGPARTNTAAKTTAPAQNIGYQTRDAYWVTPALR